VLRRQKILLTILHQSKRPISPIEVVKLAFLVRNESEIGESSSFYDFVPYKYGPFSFALYRELEGLQNNGYVEVSDASVRLSERLHTDALSKVRQLTERELNAVTRIVAKYSTMKANALVHDVYSRYPWFTLNSELTDIVPHSRPKRPKGRIAVYTSGYEGKSVDYFFDILLHAGVRRVIDVRFNPVSRKYGFAGSSLRRIGEKLGIAYSHMPALGISGEHRECLDDYDSYQKLLDRYAHTFLKKQEAALTILAVMLRQLSSVLVCMERDVECCHRGRLAIEMASRTSLPIVHL
jgi:uncharacterized protein (DUF488 family)